jgi:hypothetical protein
MDTTETSTDVMTPREILSYFGWGVMPRDPVRSKFPAPVKTPAGSVWRRPEIEAWARERNLPDPMEVFSARAGAFWRDVRNTLMRAVADSVTARVRFLVAYSPGSVQRRITVAVYGRAIKCVLALVDGVLRARYWDGSNLVQEWTCPVVSVKWWKSLSAS